MSMTDREIADRLTKRYCVPGRDSISASNEGGLDKWIFRADGWEKDRPITTRGAQWFASWISLGRWDVIDGAVRPFFHGNPVRQ